MEERQIVIIHYGIYYTDPGLIDQYKNTDLKYITSTTGIDELINLYNPDIECDCETSSTLYCFICVVNRVFRDYYNINFVYDVKIKSNLVVDDIIKSVSDSNNNIIEIYIKNLKDVEFYNHRISIENVHDEDILVYRFLSTIGTNNISTKNARF